jgi:hypothetical protein
MKPERPEIHIESTDCFVVALCEVAELRDDSIERAGW